MHRTLVAAVIWVLMMPAAGLAQTPFAEESIRKAVSRDGVALSQLAAPIAFDAARDDSFVLPHSLWNGIKA